MAKQPFEEKKKSDSGNSKEDAIEVMATVIEPLDDVIARNQSAGRGAPTGFRRL